MSDDPARLLAAEGYVALDTLLSGAEVAEALEALEAVFAEQADIALDRHWTTPTYRVAYALPARHPWFVRLVGHEALTAVARAVLGPDMVLSAFNGIDLPPGGTPQALHRDHPHPTPGHVLTVQVVVALDAFREATGATRVVPRSHRCANTEHGTGDPGREQGAIVIEVPAGGGVAYDGALVHAGGANRSDRPRRALHLFYARSWVTPHWDLARSMDAQALRALDDVQRSLLGLGRGPRRYDRAARRVVR